MEASMEGVSNIDSPVSCSSLIAAEDREMSCNAVNRQIQAGGATDSLRKEAGSLMNYVVLDSISTEFDLAVLGIKRSKVIGLAMEGIRDGRLGELCWLQISLDKYTFLFDMIALRSEAFDEGLKDVIEDYGIVKVVHDCRAMSDYLFHHHNIRLVNVFDTQVADVVLFRMRNVDLLPMEGSDLSICLMKHLSLPSALLLTRYVKVLRDETAETWKRRPASDSVLEAAVFRVCYLPRLRLRMIELLLTRFMDGCDVYLGLMRDAGDNQITRLESQIHLLPSEFEDLAFFADTSRQHLQELKQREVVYQHSTIRSVPIRDGSCTTFFNGGSKLTDLVEHGLDISPNGLTHEMNALGDEDDLDDDSLIHDVDYDILMPDVDALDDLCQKDVVEDDPVTGNVSDLFLDVKDDSLSGNMTNDSIKDEDDLTLTTQKVKCDVMTRLVTNDLPVKVTGDLTLHDLNKHVHKSEAESKMSQRPDSDAVGDSDNCHKVQNVMMSCNSKLDIVQHEETGAHSKMLGSSLKESCSEKPVRCLEKQVRFVKKRVGFSEKPVGYLENPVGCSEKLVGSLEKSVGLLKLKKPLGCSEKLLGSLEKPVGHLEKPLRCSEKLVGVNDLVSKTKTNTQNDGLLFNPAGHEKFTGLKNLPHRERFPARGNSGGKPFLPRRPRFKSQRNFRKAMFEWLDARRCRDESPDSTGVSSEQNPDDFADDGRYESYVTEHRDEVGDSCNVICKDVGDTQNQVGRDLGDSQEPLGENIGDFENPDNRDVSESQNPFGGEVGESENTITGVDANCGANQIESIILGNCGFSDRSDQTSLKQGLLRSRLPKKFANDPSVKLLLQAASLQDGKNKGNAVFADGIRRVNLAACGRGKALAKAVELLQLQNSS